MREKRKDFVDSPTNKELQKKKIKKKCKKLFNQSVSKI